MLGSKLNGKRSRAAIRATTPETLPGARSSRASSRVDGACTPLTSPRCSPDARPLEMYLPVHPARGRPHLPIQALPAGRASAGGPFFCQTPPGCFSAFRLICAARTQRRGNRHLLLLLVCFIMKHSIQPLSTVFCVAQIVELQQPERLSHDFRMIAFCDFTNQSKNAGITPKFFINRNLEDCIAICHRSCLFVALCKHRYNPLPSPLAIP